MSMRKIREVLRLTHELGLSVREVREATGVGKTAVSEYVRRAKVVGITWPIPPCEGRGGFDEDRENDVEDQCILQVVSSPLRRDLRQVANKVE